MRTTKSEQPTNTLQLSHKHITNPTIIHTDKVMNVISVCATVLRGVTRGKTLQELQDLQQSMEFEGRTVSKNTLTIKRRTAQDTATPPRVQHITTQIQILRSVSMAQAPDLRVEQIPELTVAVT